MRALFSDLFRSDKKQYTLILLDVDGTEHPRQYQVSPHQLLTRMLAGAAGLVVLVVMLVAFTPLRELIPGYASGEVRQEARLNVLRIAALQDSLAIQQQYVSQLRHLITGQIDSAFVADLMEPAAQAPAFARDLVEHRGSSVSEDWGDHEQPAIPFEAMPAGPSYLARPVAANRSYLSGLRFPLQPPVDGFLTRGFDALAGHFAVDIAVEEGTAVRSVGDGYVVFSDWSHEGGYTIVVQHANGFLSMYKHNVRLLKQVGDRVREREVIAMSGNSGEITTGPHLHFELWHEGLAQDPRQYMVGW